MKGSKHLSQVCAALQDFQLYYYSYHYIHVKQIECQEIFSFCDKS